MEATHFSSTLFSVPGISTRLIILAMATAIMYRRFTGRSCKAAVFPTATKVQEQKILFRAAEGSWSTIKTSKRPKPAVRHTLLVPSEYRVSFSPPAYPMTKCLYHEDGSRGLGNGSLEGDSAVASPKQVQNTDSTTCSQRLSSKKNTMVELGESGVRSSQPTLTYSLKQAWKKCDGHHDPDTEVYNHKENPRIFQKQRPEYGSLCYSNEKCFPPLSVEKSEQILQKVSLLKNKLKPGTIGEYFFKLSCLPAKRHHTVLSNHRFGMLCHYAVRNIQGFHIDDFIVTLKAFVALAIPSSHSVLKEYEKECCRRVQDMSLNQLLLVADLWHCMGHSVPQYLESMLSYVNLHWKELTLPQLVQLIYIIGEGRKAPEELMKKLEVLVSMQLESLSLEEVGVICLGFFKSKNYISRETVRKIGDKACAHMASISNFALVNILKMYRFTYVEHIDFLKQLGQFVPPKIQTMAIPCIMHLILAFSALHYLDEKLMNAVASSVPSKVAYCRSKDVAKLLWSFGNLNHEPPNAEEFYVSLEKHLHVKFHEFQKYPEHFITALLALAFAERYHYDLIDYALGPKFISLSKEGKYVPDKDLLTLDSTVAIECPDYTGNRLTPQFRQEVTDEVINSAIQNLSKKPEITLALFVLEDILKGPLYVKKHFILPHTRTFDLEINLDSNQNPLPFNSEAVAKVPLKLNMNATALTDDLMNQLLKGKTSNQTHLVGVENKIKNCIQEGVVQQNLSLSTQNRHPSSDGVPLTRPFLLNTVAKAKTSLDPDPQLQGGMKLAIQVSSRNHYCYGSKHLLGLHNLKRRQLRQLGYVVIEVPFWEWFPLLNRRYTDKWNYLHPKVFSSFSEKKPKCQAESEL